MTRAHVLAGLLLLLPLDGAAGADLTAHFYGYAYDLKSERYLYTEVHEQKISGGQWRSGTIRYFAPDGTLMGVKKMDFSANPFIPVYDYQLPALRYREAITRVDSRIEMLRTRDGTSQTVSIANEPPMAADSGFHSFLRAHFQELLDGKVVTFSLVAVGNLESFRFRARRIADTRFEGRAAVRFRLEADSLLRIVAPELELTYDPEQQRLLEYRGPTNVIDPATDKLYPTRIVYPAHPPLDAPRNLPPLGR